MIVKNVISFVMGGGAAVAAVAALTLPGFQQPVEAAVSIPPPATNVIVTEGDQTAVFGVDVSGAWKPCSSM